MADKMRYTYPNESFSGCDMVATLLIPNKNNTKKSAYAIGELQTISYSIHMDRKPIRSIGNINAKDYVMGPRTIAGSLVFAVFNKHFANKIMKDIAGTIDNGYSFLIDEIPPFDIILSLANEYGLRSRIVIYGVRLVNEGQVMSINDVYTENTYQFVATDLEYMTDENKYTSTSQSWHSRYIITDDDTNYNNSNNQSSSGSSSTNQQDKQESVELSYKDIISADQYSQGRVTLELNPLQSNGDIIIKGNDTEINIPISNNFNGNDIIISLKAGQYSAVWSNYAKKSNSIEFIIPYVERESTGGKKAPIIENITSKSISIFSNVEDHTKFLCKDLNTEEIIKGDLIDKRFTIEELKESNDYFILTMNEKESSLSESVETSTLAKDENDIDKLVAVLINNEVLLKHDIEIYLNLISDINNFFNMPDDLYKYISITEILIEMMYKYKEQLEKCKPENFESEFEYIKEFNKITTNIEICIELKSISTVLNNDKTYGYNYKYNEVPSALLEVQNFSTNTLKIDEKIDSLIIYKRNRTKIVFDRIVRKNEFKINNDGEIVYIFSGKENSVYYIYTRDINGNKSHRIEVNLLENDIRSELLNKLSDELYNKDYEVQKFLNSTHYYIDTNLLSKDDLLKLSILNNVSKSVVKNFPVEFDYNNEKIIIKTDYQANLLNDGLKLAISKVDDYFQKTFKHKIKLSISSNFNKKNHGIKNDDYLIWVEDKNNTIISKPTLFEFRNKNISNMYLDTIISDIKNIINKNCLVNTKSYEMINKIITENISTKHSFLNKIIENMFVVLQECRNKTETLIDFFDYYYKDFIIDENFLNNNIYINDENIIIKADGCYIEYFSINPISESVEMIESKINNNFIMDKDSESFTVVNLISSDLKKRSGIIIINNNTLYTKYINREGVETKNESSE